MKYDLKPLVYCIACLATIPAFADDPAVTTAAQNPDTFVVKNIEIQGLQRVSRETVLNYLNVKPNQTLTAADSGKIIKDLYATNFFSQVSVARSGDTLIIHVEERAVIGNIKITGYQTIDKDKIDEVMKSVGLAEGREFDEATLKKFTDSLQQQYY